MLSDEEFNEIERNAKAYTLPGPLLQGWSLKAMRKDVPRLLDALREARKAHEKCGTEWAEGVMGMTKQRNEAHRALEELLDYVDHSPRCRYVINQQLPFGGFEGCECGLKEAVSRAVKLVGAQEPEDA